MEASEAFSILTAKHTCKACKGINFGRSNGNPVTGSGWYGGQRFEWGQYANVHMPRIVALRCEDCGNEVAVDPEWD